MHKVSFVYPSPSRLSLLQHVSVLLSRPTQHISLFCSTLPLTKSLCFALPSHSAHLSVLLSLPTQHISLFCSPFPLNTSLCFALPSHSTHSTQLYRSPLPCRCCLDPFIPFNPSVLPVTSCGLQPASRWSQFPLFPCTLILHDHEPEPQYELHVTVLCQKRFTNIFKTQQIYYTIPLPGYMIRLLRVIIRPSNELAQNYLIPSALWDPVRYRIPECTRY